MMLKIGVFSTLSMISIRMLRHYDEIGLLVPREIDNFTGYRYYTESQLLEAERISALKHMGFGLAATQEILKVYDNPHALAEFLTVRHAQAAEEAAQLNSRLLLLENTIHQLQKGELIMQYNVTLKTLPERYVASVRQTIPTYQDEGRLWGIFCQETDHMQLQDASPCYTLAIFHDKEHKEHDVDVEVQKNLKGTYNNTEHVVFKTAPAVDYASATYKGSYEQITAVNKAVAAWVVDNGYEFNGAHFCIYHVSPYESQNPDDYVTEVCFPVKKK